MPNYNSDIYQFWVSVVDNEGARTEYPDTESARLAYNRILKFRYHLAKQVQPNDPRSYGLYRYDVRLYGATVTITKSRAWDALARLRRPRD
jgi:hypothetical protein